MRLRFTPGISNSPLTSYLDIHIKIRNTMSLLRLGGTSILSIRLTQKLKDFQVENTKISLVAILSTKINLGNLPSQIKEKSHFMTRMNPAQKSKKEQVS